MSDDSNPSSEARVRAYYDADPDREWSRFERHPFEFPVTMHHLGRHLAPRSRVLDVGGGPGRYAIELTRLGHRVELLDLSPVLVDRARGNAAAAGIELAGVHVGNATDLSRFEDAAFDAVLCMGPLYHLVAETERQSVLDEALRVLKPGGLLFAAYITLNGRLFDLLRNRPEALVDHVDRYSSMLTGSSLATADEPGFTDAWFVQPHEVTAQMIGRPLTQLALLGVEGPVSHSEGTIARHGPEVTRAWIELAIQVAHTPAALYGSDHLLFIGRRDGNQQVADTFG